MSARASDKMNNCEMTPDVVASADVVPSRIVKELWPSRLLPPATNKLGTRPSGQTIDQLHVSPAMYFEFTPAPSASVMITPGNVDTMVPAVTLALHCDTKH